MVNLFDEKTRSALRKKVRKDLEPMRKAIFEYHLKKSQGGEKMEKIDMLKTWIKEMIYPYEISRFIFDIKGSNDPNKERKWLFDLYTETNPYRITAIDRKDEEGYLGCIFSRRKQRVGEDWTRDSDLSHGPFTKETWDKIKNSIIRNELVELVLEIVPDIVESTSKCARCDRQHSCDESSAVFSLMSS